MRDDSAFGAILATIAIQFSIMSLLAFGGATAVVPEIHRQVVEIQSWMSERQFADLFAISQAAPGPNVMIVSLMGFHVAGVPGAVVAMIAMCGPTAVLACFISHAWDRFREAKWRVAVQAGLVPISVGLIGATALILTGIADHNWVAVGITAATAAVATWTKWNSLWLFGVASLMGLVGLV